MPKNIPNKSKDVENITILVYFHSPLFEKHTLYY